MPAMRAPKPSTTHARTHARTHPLPLAHTLSPSHTQASAPLLTRELEAAGLHAARLLWLPLQPRVTHLRRAQRMGGLSLDTPGYNQGTSGLDALWSGLPLLTLPLTHWCGRMGAGLVTTVGLPHAQVRAARAVEDAAVALAAPPRCEPRILGGALGACAEGVAVGASASRSPAAASRAGPQRGRRRWAAVPMEVE